MDTVLTDPMSKGVLEHRRTGPARGPGDSVKHASERLVICAVAFASFGQPHNGTNTDCEQPRDSGTGGYPSSGITERNGRNVGPHVSDGNAIN